MNKERTIAAIRINLIVFITVSITALSCSRSSITDLTLEHQNTVEDADEQTLQSIQNVGGLFTVIYYGEYEERLKWLNDYHISESAKLDTKTNCSLFAAYTSAGEPILGRNFDRNRETPVLTKFSPDGKFASFAFSPGSEVNLHGVVGVSNPTEEQKNSFLYCLPFYATDGINEKGLSIAIAGAPPRNVSRAGNSKPMFVLLFIRHVLDNCQTIDEVARFAETVSLYDSDNCTISHHFVVIDASGKWLVIDYPDGDLRLSYGQDESQIRTNHFLEGGPAIDNTSFTRYNSLYESLNTSRPLASESEAMNLLNKVRNATKWSVVYNSHSNSGLVVVQEKYRRQYRFGFSKDQ